ncbi:GNAT family N-acetyltransferase [Bacillus sp. HMF5848]|uniref:GNAT family N-acetyltransferase n=1 Tax=Bacillus sp. HMF5848 TaxID=2495421 RepID=UPI000F7BA27B|nr:GNAT family N-acetyltransferase [Bacillus sp. HMF5848]RSK27193.1 GNAT family N-acetyltransferase [Bacillus sp. HMF5848]
MPVQKRRYEGPEDFTKVNQFLINTYEPGGFYPNWLQPRWEYMHTHPYFDETSLNKIAIWEEDGNIVAVVNYELELGDTYFAVHPDYTYLKRDMFEHAEKHLLGTKDNGNKYLRLYIKEFDRELEEIALLQGYEKDNDYPEFNYISQFKIPDVFPKISIPEGYKLKSLAEDNDHIKVDRVMWRGFNHKGESPQDIEGRKKMQSGPNYRKDLNIVVEAPDGNFVAYCGMWFVEENKIAYVEPVCTDPDYRRLGLGKAAVLEGIRRCGELGATVAFVETGMKFYLDIGFQPVHSYYPWEKEFK